ncbi:MAG: hypothetical protein AAGC44_05730 [Planctomycetota bacterium]
MADGRGDDWALCIEQGTGNPDAIVHGSSASPISSHFNLWSSRQLDRDWYILNED